jgi:hypothetical protein
VTLYSNLIGETHRRQGDLISLILFFQNKGSRLKMKVDLICCMEMENSSMDDYVKHRHVMMTG